MRARFDRQLDELNEQMTRMGMLCETAIERSSEALLNHDISMAESVRKLQEQIGEMHRDIENRCFRLLMQQQPVARDLRTISSALKMVTDMGRIGVQSGEIAEIVTMDAIRSVDPELPIRDMAQSTIRMVTRSLDAFVRKDVDMARKVINDDDEVDSYFNQVKKKLIEEIRTTEEDGAMVLDLLMIAKYLERIGDHAVNIAEWVAYSVTGEMEGLDI
ncbi:phosphate uptake regulator, PhoU [Eubacterium pyruvativorans]|uniref:Phosphate-specific transport system accessory protein PhoU n=1 Tax=Eubacterium pyruvativorans TaxID=155865 RepID=A0A1I7HJY7_9FIRM|nr:phosphate signaling complex protein PhoU [Eubacterium pyruvativorans]MCI5746312.1 phosphate signaling complex protein PhoU [Eubacterium pyruvativorans]MDD6707547.1 phosphate signaling complex protein PhoU [Eubacterium pyruvativorans]MDD7684240.1 phosphate signaling complex protein PhoU [Eubacterium pyruvativorans]MDY4049276.1 phosphate signaling complex protein PhoU [Eubacterium pyruvativorans]SDF19688.1 phosphate transport system protein [Eubacterium pyruvativorans]